MATLNVTYQGRSADLPQEVRFRTPLADLRRIAYEALQSGGSPALARRGTLPKNAFREFVVDRFENSGGPDRVYLRPKVPFG